MRRCKCAKIHRSVVDWLETLTAHTHKHQPPFTEIPTFYEYYFPPIHVFTQKSQTRLQTTQCAVSPTQQVAGNYPRACGILYACLCYPHAQGGDTHANVTYFAPHLGIPWERGWSACIRADHERPGHNFLHAPCCILWWRGPLAHIPSDRTVLREGIYVFLTFFLMMSTGGIIVW